jgi:hypothetical protein
MSLPADVSPALARFMREERLSAEEAILTILRDWLTAHGYLPTHKIEDAEPEGNA